MKKLVLSLMLACMSCATQAAEINVYSARHYDTDKAVFDSFTKQTGITVNLLQSSGAQLLARLESEGDKSPADVLISTSAAHVFRAADKNLLSPFADQTVLANVPAHMRAADGSWIGFALRARIVFANPALVDVTHIKTYADLAKPEFKGKLCMRSGGNEYNIALLSSIIAHEGTEAATTWARGLVVNFARDPQGNDRDNILAVAKGVCGLTVANTYYYGILMDTAAGQDKKDLEKLVKIFPNQETTGSHTNISAVSILKTAPHKSEAEKFIQFLLQTNTQKALTAASHEYAVLPNIADKPDFKMDPIAPAVFGGNTSIAQTIVDTVGWK